MTVCIHDSHTFVVTWKIHVVKVLICTCFVMLALKQSPLAYLREFITRTFSKQCREWYDGRVVLEIKELINYNSGCNDAVVYSVDLCCVAENLFGDS